MVQAMRPRNMTPNIIAVLSQCRLVADSPPTTPPAIATVFVFLVAELGVLVSVAEDERMFVFVAVIGALVPVDGLADMFAEARTTSNDPSVFVRMQ